jgi:hypothetical protein
METQDTDFLRRDYGFANSCHAAMCDTGAQTPTYILS